MSSDVAVALLRPPVVAGAKHSAPMAALLHSTNEPVPVSNPISGTPTSIAKHEPLSFLKSHPKPDSNLSSIASAGLNVSRSNPSQMTNTAPATADRPVEQEREAERNSSQVAREALGASEKSPGPPARQPSVHASPERMQVDSHATDAPPDPYGATDHHQNSLMHTSTVASPGPIEESASQDGERSRPREDSEIDQDSNKAFSYPMPTGGVNDPRRGLSLPHTGYNRGSPRSPSTKKHRCPYCATEFTRQHNLKSHLLTHSQEKPFVCQTCQSRFRRLHDLKRHTKLHTGERPHICPKCGRRFARGDALARHNKGQGGCAGRRSSMGSFAADDEYGDGHHPDDAMDGLVYAEPERMDEEDERRLDTPNMRKHDADHLPRADPLQPRQPSTYPPIAAGRSGLYPPPTTHAGPGSSASSTSPAANMTFPPVGHSSGATIFTPTSVSDSPKPLSPNALSHQDTGVQSYRAHSPGMAQSLPQPQPHPFGRAGSGSSHGPSGLGLPPPQPGAPHLPPPVINQHDSRFGLQGTSKHTPSHSHSSSHGLPAHKVGPEGPEAAGDSSQIDKLWAYVRSMHEEMTGLRAEVASLRAQIASTNASTAPPPVEVNQLNPGPR